MKATNAADLQKIIDAKGAGGHLAGIYEDKQLPRSFGQGGSFILLTNPKLAIGHWVLVFVRGNEASYVDPFGQVTSLEILRCLKSTPGIRNRIRSTFDIQNLKSDSCGEICAAIFIQLSRGMTLQQALSPFSNDTEVNERMIQLMLM